MGGIQGGVPGSQMGGMQYFDPMFFGMMQNNQFPGQGQQGFPGMDQMNFNPGILINNLMKT